MKAFSRADLADIVMIMESPEEYDFCGYVDLETGEILLKSPDLDDDDDLNVDLDYSGLASEGRYVQIPGRDSREAWRDMEDFIGTVEDPHLRDLLDVAIRGKGAFRRFKDVLSRSDYTTERQRWFRFKNDREEARTIAWLVSENLPVDV